MRLLIRWAINTMAIVGATYILPKVTLTSWKSALVVGVLLSILNTFVRPIFSVLTLPINVATLGLVVLVTNGLVLMILDWVMAGLKVDGFLWTVVAAIFIAVIATVINILVGEDEKPSSMRPRR